MAVWYPTNAPHNQSRLGLFDVDYARDAKPIAGQFPLVLLSHGHSGRPRNHHLTAAALVRAGYVVAAPQHRFDHLVFQSRLIYAMHQRIAEIGTAHRAVIDHPVIGPVIDVGDVDHVELEDGHHFAFIAPFADRVTREETTPVALDPAGFDRAAWLDDVNQQIVAFMLR